MAVRIVKERVCDICQSDEGVKSYRVGLIGDGRGTSPDLCGEHAAPIEKVMAAAKATKPQAGLRKPRTVTTPEAIAKQRRKKPTK